MCHLRLTGKLSTYLLLITSHLSLLTSLEVQRHARGVVQPVITPFSPGYVIHGIPKSRLALPGPAGDAMSTPKSGLCQSLTAVVRVTRGEGPGEHLRRVIWCAGLS